MDGTALLGAGGFAPDGAGLGFAEMTLDLIEVGKLAEDPANKARGLILGFEKFSPNMGWQSMRVMWSLLLAQAG